MTEIFPGRWTARMTEDGEFGEDGIVLFLIGMRVNQWWRLDQLFWVIRAMSGMLAHLNRHPEAGLLRARNWFGRTTMQVGYWRSLADLVEFAGDRESPHRPAWQRYYRKAATSAAIGIWHETYLVKPGGFETVYANMPAFGLAEATARVKVDRTTSSARQRIRSAG